MASINRQTPIFYIILITQMDNTQLWFWNMGTWLIILILFLFMWWNGNWFWFGNNNAAWMAWLANSNNNHDNTVELINNNSFWQQQLANQQSIANLTNQMNMWFCNTNQNIEKAILAGQQNTASIIASSAANVQRVLDKLCEQETDRLRTALAEARVIANNTQQTADIVNAIRPFPQSAYIVSSPYTSIYPPTTTA